MDRPTLAGLTRRGLLARTTLALAGAAAADLGPRAGAALARSQPGGPASTQQTCASRALAAYQALQQYFYVNDGTGLYRETYPFQGGNPYAYLWPFSRALIGTLTVAGIPSSLVGGVNYQPAVSDRLTALGRYWDAAASPPGYDAYVVPPTGKGGDKYYDDQAWVGLALAQHYRMTATESSLSAAKRVLAFVYPGGWDAGNADPYPGGIYWIQQGVGVGATNHDRTTTSNAPNGELAFQLEQLDPGNAASYDAEANRMHGWVSANLYDVNGSGLVYDKVRGDGSIDSTLWTYNQGALIASGVMRYRLGGQAGDLAQAEATASHALAHFSESGYISQPAAFNAIYFRGLLQLYSLTANSTLKASITTAMQAYANDAWSNHRSKHNLFSFSPTSSGTYRLLDQGAMVALFAALAWNAGDYAKLA